MGSDTVFWIVCGCLIFSLCESFWRYLRAMRNSFAADEHLKPDMYVPMSPSDIKEWKEKHQAKLAETTESENTGTECERDVEDE